MNFWKRAEELLTGLEKILARWCMIQLGLNMDAWGKWNGREAEFYRQCAHLAGSLRWQDVLSIAGPKMHVLSRQVQYSFCSMKWFPVPARLKVGTFRKVEAGPDGFRIWSYSRNDPIDLSKTEMETLRSFDGRPVTEMALQESVLRKWLDYRLLVPA